MIVTVWHVNGHYYREINGIKEEITVDEWLAYFTD